ncbi:MAG: PH domain-containing protein [Spirochaetia bacterium]|nr:PH domain-containing protein [Spirochaetia bacterium]
MNYYNAPWGKSLKIITILASVLLIVGSIKLFLDPSGDEKFPNLIGLLLIIFLLGCSLFTIRGYSITPDNINVHRLFWKTLLPRKGIIKGEVDSVSPLKSIRTFGNGGLFSFSGFFYLKSLGHYRGYITDWNNCLILHYEKKKKNGTKKIIISPERPKDFLSYLDIKEI